MSISTRFLKLFRKPSTLVEVPKKVVPLRHWVSGPHRQPSCGAHETEPWTVEVSHVTCPECRATGELATLQEWVNLR